MGLAPASVPLTPFPSPQAKPQGRGGKGCSGDAFGSARTPSLRSSASRPSANETWEKSHSTPLCSVKCSCYRSLIQDGRPASRTAAFIRSLR